MGRLARECFTSRIGPLFVMSLPLACPTKSFRYRIIGFTRRCSRIPAELSHSSIALNVVSVKRARTTQKAPSEPPYCLVRETPRRRTYNTSFPQEFIRRRCERELRLPPKLSSTFALLFSRCDTFDNPPLCSREAFDVSQLEVRCTRAHVPVYCQPTGPELGKKFSSWNFSASNCTHFG